jgi:hypothetical protein
MSDKVALKIAIDLMHVPSQVRLLRSEPLPDGVLTLLRIAAGDAEAEGTAATAAERPPAVVQQAATFFIEQILFAPNADSYRVLGASPQASAAELRRNVALLLRWLHPDRDPQDERSVFVGRVTAAWNDLKTPERRVAYDQARQDRTGSSRSSAKVGRRGKRPPSPAVAPYRGAGGRRVLLPYPNNGGGLLHRALAILFRISRL